MALGDGIRRNIANVDPEERALLRDAFVELNTFIYPGFRSDQPPGGVSWWFKQDEIHQATHVHNGPEFLPWHRVIVNRLEEALRQINPRLSLHYWDWTQDPRAIPNANLGGGRRGTLNLFTPDFMGYGGTSVREIGEPWLSARYYVPGASPHRDESNNPADPPNAVVRSVSGSPTSRAQDSAVIGAGDYREMRLLLEQIHNTMHGFVNMGGQHISFRDPFVFLLHSNVDRLFARWQVDPGHPDRLDPNTIYGSEAGNPVFNRSIIPWSGIPPLVRPWAPPENEGDPQTYRDPRVVVPPAYDTNQYLHVERSRPLNAPKATGAPSGIVFPALSVTNIVYRDDDGRLHELWQQGAQTGTSNLTQLAGNPSKAVDDPTPFIDTVDNLEVALYRGADGHVHSLYWSTGPVGHDALSAAAGAPHAVGSPAGYVQRDGTKVVIYRRSNGHFQSLFWIGQGTPGTEDLTAPSGSPPAAGDPAPYINTITGENIIAYRGTDGHIHTMFWTGPGAVGHDDLSGVAGSPKAAGDPAAYYVSRDDVHQVTYRSQDGHLHELWWVGVAPVQGWDLIAATVGAPLAASDPAAYYSAGTNTKHVFYRSANNHLNEIFWVPGGLPMHVDLTEAAQAPLAADKPTAFTVEGPNSQHVVYRGTDGHIHEIRWTPAPVRTTIDLNGRWTGGGPQNIVISAAFSLIAVDMSQFGRPAAHGFIVDGSTISVTFPDDATYTGILQAPATIRWSNGSAWRKVASLGGSDRRPVPALAATHARNG
jgi:hypothetical protein